MDAVPNSQRYISFRRSEAGTDRTKAAIRMEGQEHLVMVQGEILPMSANICNFKTQCRTKAYPYHLGRTQFCCQRLLKMIRVSGGCVRGWKSVTGNAT
jgi:hypothetical protein